MSQTDAHSETQADNAAPSADRPDEILAFLERHLDQVTLLDAPKLQKRIAGARRAWAEDRLNHEALGQLVSTVDQSAAIVASRRQQALIFDYPENLPVSQARDEIMRTIAEHPVVVIAGETGSGKTTQLPKMLMELGYGTRGLIGHTQPRRLAARSVASRLAEELTGGPLGAQHSVGFKVRFTDHTRPDSRVAVMTDGILLAELAHDRELSRYDALIIDEAHERSLNIDFLMGVVQRILPQRPDFRLIITSATIDLERFAQHFGHVDPESGDLKPAPVIQVSGRSYPVEMRYRPLNEETSGEDDGQTEDRDLADAVVAAVDELAGEGNGDILVFLPGEREIRDCAQRLGQHHPRHTEILPLYARLSAAEQQQVFSSHTGRRIVLSTNVAETSLTVPGIRYVIDSGLARIARYHPRSRLQKLAIEPISQASANQRAGRCGRIAPGICIRLYAEDDFDGRPAFTDPEIRRTNLAAVLLQLASLKLGLAEQFPFIDPPDSRQLSGARKHLFELGALDDRERLTKLGRQLSRLPLDPTLGRMVLAAIDGPESAGEHTLADTLIVTSFLAIQDPRERPAEHRQAADQAHKAFAVTSSDFAGVLNLWFAWHEQARHLSHRKRRDWAKRHFLSFVRMQEWHDLFGQLRQIVDEMTGERIADPEPLPGVPRQEEADVGKPEKDKATKPTADDKRLQAKWQRRLDGLHQALLTGLLAHIGMRDEVTQKARNADDKRAEAANFRGKKRRQPLVYIGASQRRFQLFPGSALMRQPPKWLMSAEIVETQRVFARMNAAINPRWIEPLAGHLINRQHGEPQWDRRGARATVSETVNLFGLPIVTKRRVDMALIDPVGAREWFIREALVHADWDSNARFWRENQQLIEEIRDLEARQRRPDILVDDEVLFDFYAQRVPADVHNGTAFERWRKQAEQKQPDLLILTREDLMQREPDELTIDQFPDRMRFESLSLALDYHFEPGSPEDGVTLKIPLPALNQVDTDRCTHLVPGLRQEKIEALIRSLPKAQRRHFVPAPEFALAVAGRIDPEGAALTEQLARELQRMTGHALEADAFDERKLEPHLRMRFALTDAKGNPIDADRSLSALRTRHHAASQAAFAERTRHRLERDDITRWDFGDLPDQVEIDQAGATLTAWPTLIDDGDHVRIEMLDSPDTRALAERAGLTRLLLLAQAEGVRHLTQTLKQDRGLGPARLQYAQLKAHRTLPRFGLKLPNKDETAFNEQLIATACARIGLDEQPPVRTEAQFEQRLQAVLPELHDETMKLAEHIRKVLDQQHKLRMAIKGRLPLSKIEAAREVGEQLDALIFPGFIWHLSKDMLDNLPRWLTAIEKRLEKIDRHPERDRMQRVQFMPLWTKLETHLQSSNDNPVYRQQVDALHHQIEELRVSIFAQELSRKGNVPNASQLESALDKLQP